MASFQHSKPNVSEQMVIDLILENYALEVTSIKPMVSYDDQNYHVKVSKNHRNPYITTPSEEGYTFKITNPQKTNRIEWTHRCFIHLHQKGLYVPYPVQNLDGNTWKMETVPITTKDKTDLCGIHLLTYISGDPVSKVPYTSKLLFQWGLLLAKSHHALSDFESPKLEKPTVWDLEHVPEVMKYLDCLDEDKSKLVTDVIEKFNAEIPPNVANLPKGFIHGDFNETNILAQTCTDGGHRVEGILDPEDVHYGTYTWDVGVMLAYTMLDCESMDPLEGTGHALAGYFSIRQLSFLEKSLLKICIESRFCQSLVLGTYNFTKDPTNSYLNHSCKTGWERLEKIHNVTNSQLQEIWSKVQKQYT